LLTLLNVDWYLTGERSAMMHTFISMDIHIWTPRKSSLTQHLLLTSWGPGMSSCLTSHSPADWSKSLYRSLISVLYHSTA